MCLLVHLTSMATTPIESSPENPPVLTGAISAKPLKRRLQGGQISGIQPRATPATRGGDVSVASHPAHQPRPF